MRFIPKSNWVNHPLMVCRALLDHFNVRYTILDLSKRLEDHVEFPSLLSIHEVLNEYGVSSVAIKRDEYSYSDFEIPFVCPIHYEGRATSSLTVVTEVNNEYITYLDPDAGKLTTKLLSDFERIDKGIVLLIDAENAIEEKNYALHKKHERSRYLWRYTAILVAFFSLILPIYYLLYGSNSGGEKWGSFIYLLNGLIGAIIVLLLLWYEIDTDNPFLKNVCGGGGKRADCRSVIASIRSRFLGTSWSVWGFGYFGTLFLTNVLYPGSDTFLAIWSLLSIIVAFYIPFSLYYQQRIIKAWCTLCLSIQALLFVNLINSGWYLSSNRQIEISWYQVVMLLLIGSALVLLAHHGVPLLKKARDGDEYKKKWRRLLYKPEVFEILLQKSNSISSAVDDLGIVIGRHDAKNEITKVCNPYCGPCSKVHPILENIVTNNVNVKLRIIFIASGEGIDSSSFPVAHLLSLEEMDNQEKMVEALDAWYLSDEKDYQRFAEKFPVNGELELDRQWEKIEKMNAWCEQMKIRATPTIFINGKELPDDYQVEEIKNFL